jgi:hypothetical protein
VFISHSSGRPVGQTGSKPDGPEDAALKIMAAQTNGATMPELPRHSLSILRYPPIAV